MSDLADAGRVLPADLSGVATVVVAPLADAGMAFPSDLAGLATDLADVGCSPESGGDIVMWGDRTSSGVWCRADTPSRSDVDCQYVGCVGYVPVGMDCAAPAAGCYYEEWCAWNDVEEYEGYYAPFRSR